jgi:hypothetical protein
LHIDLGKEGIDKGRITFSNIGEVLDTVTKQANISITGNANTATKWLNSRNFSIGATASSEAGSGISVNGTADAQLTLPQRLDGFISITSTNFFGNNFKIGNAVTLQYNSGDKCMDVIFN